MPGRRGLGQQPGGAVGMLGASQAASEPTLDASIVESPLRHLPPNFAGWLAAVVEGGPVEEVILFGSRVRGDHGPNSDIDLLIVTTRPRSSPEFSAFEEKLQCAVDDFDATHRPIAIGRPVLAFHRSRVRRALKEGLIELFEALTQGVQLYPHQGGRSLHQPELASFSYRCAAARWLALAREFILDAETGHERLSRADPLAYLTTHVGTVGGFSAQAARAAMHASMWSGLLSLGMRPGSHSAGFMQTALGWPVARVSSQGVEVEAGELIAAARQYVELASALLPVVKLPSLRYDDRWTAKLLLAQGAH